MTSKPGKTPSHLADDPYLGPYLSIIEFRQARAAETEKRLTEAKTSLCDFASAHEFFGLHLRNDKWIIREWAPNADSIYLIGDFNDWHTSDQHKLQRVSETGVWELAMPRDALKHGQLYKLLLSWPGGSGERIPAYARRVVQNPESLVFSAQVWRPEMPYQWKISDFTFTTKEPLVYEAHVGMAQEEPRLGTYREFADNIVPRISEAGYNTIQLMAVMEHPYYGSFGYHVSSFFAASSRFGTPEDLKYLIDTAHQAGIGVVMDLVHSHAASNEVEGLARFDGTEYQYLHKGQRGRHPAWGSRCFDYSKPEVLHFLLSNCRYWLDEFKVDGFRFDGITSMIYHHHGLGGAFDSYEKYFDSSVDDDALTYLILANKVIHRIRPDAITVAEDVSGMPGLATSPRRGGIGFDYRLSMGVPDFWFRLLKTVRDDDWHVGEIYHELTNRRVDEQTISYVESHDQAIVGDKTSIFLMLDKEMYSSMRVTDSNPVIDRGIALHKLMRLATSCLAGNGYLNFMGNEFGHPEWIDFPRKENNWSYHYARRQWSLADNPDLKYQFLGAFDRAMTRLILQHELLEHQAIRLLMSDTERSLLVFERGSLFFVLNFHPSASYADMKFTAPAGSYELVLNTDSGDFGGHGRVNNNQTFVTLDEIESSARNSKLSVYAPCRTGLVLRKLT